MSSLRNQPVYDRISKQLMNRDFLVDVALGRVIGMQSASVIGVSPSISTADGEVTIMDFPGRRMIFPTGLVDVWLTSSDATDTDVDYVVIGLLADDSESILTGTLNGQTPVNAGQLAHVNAVRLTINTPNGDVYINRTNSFTAGIPDDPGDILSYVIQGKNITRNGWFKIPKGKLGLNIGILGNTDEETKPATINTYITFPGDVPLQSVTYSVSPAFSRILFPVPIATNVIVGVPTPFLTPGTLVEFTAVAKSNNTAVFFGLDLILSDAEQFGLQPVT